MHICPGLNDNIISNKEWRIRQTHFRILKILVSLKFNIHAN